MITLSFTRSELTASKLKKTKTNVLYDNIVSVPAKDYLAYLSYFNSILENWLKAERRIESDSSDSFLSWLDAINLQLLLFDPDDVNSIDTTNMAAADQNALRSIIDAKAIFTSYFDPASGNNVYIRITELNTSIDLRLPSQYVQTWKGNLFKSLIDQCKCLNIKATYIFDLYNDFPFLWLLYPLKEILSQTKAST